MMTESIGEEVLNLHRQPKTLFLLPLRIISSPTLMVGFHCSSYACIVLLNARLRIVLPPEHC